MSKHRPMDARVFPRSRRIRSIDHRSGRAGSSPRGLCITGSEQSRQSREYAVSSRLLWRYTGAAQALSLFHARKPPHRTPGCTLLHAAPRASRKPRRDQLEKTMCARAQYCVGRVAELNAMNLVQRVKCKNFAGEIPYRRPHSRCV